uniref:Uncharacterized protein n=1 Tax=Thermocrinis ruber TaxID=75906 RepID=A0A7C5SZ94_9AQUI
MAKTLLETVASLSLAKNLEFIEVVRAISLFGDQEVVYYAGKVDTPDTDDVIQVVVNKSKKGECLTPFELENWIVQKIAEGYRFDLDLWHVGEYVLDFSVGGKLLKVWYENILKFVEASQGKSVLWHSHDELVQLVFSLEIPKNDWPDYWALLVWEREELMYRFRLFISHIHYLAWTLVYKIAQRMKKHKGWIAEEYPLKVVMEYMDKKDPIKTIQHTLASELGKYDKEQKDWLSSIVWQKLLEASKENRSITLNEIRINLRYEDEEE